jgi:hypothetical protein
LCANVILLVEVKSVRPTEKVRLGSDEALAEHTRMLGKAYKQIANTDALIAAGHTSFVHIPSSLPRLGLVVTMDPSRSPTPTTFVPSMVSLRRFPSECARARNSKDWCVCRAATSTRS